MHIINTNGLCLYSEVYTQNGSCEVCFQAYDPDAGENSRLRYYMDGRVQETLSENLDNVRRSPFIVDPVSGIVKLNFDPQKGMKGYFDFKVKKC